MVRDDAQLHFDWLRYRDRAIPWHLDQTFVLMTRMQRVACVLHREGHTDSQIAEFFNVGRTAINERRRRARHRLERMGLEPPRYQRHHRRVYTNADPSLFS